MSSSHTTIRAKSTTIKLVDEFGQLLSGRTAGSAFRERLEASASGGETFIVDFEGVVAVSPSFADEIFAKLDRSLVDSGAISFINMPNSVAALGRFVRGNPARQRLTA